MSSELTPPQGAAVDFDTLALLHLDGQLDPVGHDEFSRQVARDPTKALRLAEIAELHAALGELGRTSIAQPASRPPSSRPTSSISTRMQRRSARVRHVRPLPAWGLAVAAMLVVGVFVALTAVMSPTAPDLLTVTHGSVTVENRHGRTRVSGATMPLRPGDRLMVDGTPAAHITTPQGDRLELAGGTLLTWAPQGAATSLHSGSLTADITPRSVSAPFVLRTPKADLTVLGTRFTVQADDGLSLLAVDHGRVRVSNRDDARQVEVAAKQLTVTTGTGELVATTGTLIPSAATGLTGDYFTHQDFTGWRLRRVDPMIDFDWDLQGPDPRIGGDTFSVRWRGWLVPTYSGPCTFTILMDDGVRLWLDGRLVLDEWHLSEKQEFSTTVTLEAGKAYQVRLDYYQEPTYALIRWYWAGGEHPKQPVPTSWLRPAEWTPDPP
jgi:ferric-dicitrate binding protein FerR (iron transport regulator)